MLRVCAVVLVICTALAPSMVLASGQHGSLLVAAESAPTSFERARPSPTTDIAPFSYPNFDTPENLQAETKPAAQAPTSNPGKGLRLAGMICGATGAVAVGLGVYYWTRATSLADSANHASVYKRSDYDRGKRAEKMQWIFYGAGTTALVAGATLYALGRWVLPGQTTTLSLAPVAAPGAAGLQANGTF